MPALADLVERYAIPVVHFRNRYVALPPRHPMNAGFDPNPYVKEADAILVIDCVAPWFPSRVRPREDCKVVHIAPDPLYTYVPIRGFPAHYSFACPTDVGLRMLTEAMSAHAGSNKARIGQRRDEVMARHAKLEEQWASKLKAAKDETPIAPAYLSHCINEIRTRDALIVKESPIQTQYIDMDVPASIINTGAASGLGHGMGVALGAKLANRDRLVIGTHGDGAYMFNVPTSAHFVSAEQELPVLWIILNNQRWQAVRSSTVGLNPEGYAAKANRAPLTYFTVEQHYEKSVEVSGGYGEKVTDPKQLMPALERAMKAVTVEKRQALLNVVCSVDTSGSSG
jgi:acetolactate synthase-1/2/3 large subunit